MPLITFIEFDGTTHKVEAAAGTSAMQAAVDHNISGIVADCGGSCSCATCHGYVDPAWIDRLSPADANEMAMLECVVAPEANSRLTCQLKITAETEGLVIRLPKSQF